MESLSKQDLLEIYANLNKYQWDYRLGTKPNGFDEMPDYDRNLYQTKYNVLKPYLRLLGSILTEKEVLKYHHIKNLNRTDSEFKWWWFKRKIRILLTGDPF
ncbi:hypothetical protein ACFSMW_14685 [Virgibacillus halophilus]|uniref:Uncharacterized protein n=1 Tax=Tigheibacillus halophilus TaxID=361280 RepID=A0ABU5CCS0_9BACI|nr:hypothetical protein [Virgibacillus halophilus]